jgi:hypothetical protein
MRREDDAWFRLVNSWDKEEKRNKREEERVRKEKNEEDEALSVALVVFYNRFISTEFMIEY